MKFRNITKIVAACAGIALLTSAAVAAPAKSTTSLNVRTGPGAHYRSVDALHPGELVNIDHCRNNGWCYITHRGRDGWVSARYLHQGGYQRQPKRHRTNTRRPHTPRYHNDIDEFQLNFGGSGFNFSFGVGNGKHGGRNVGNGRHGGRNCIIRHGRRYCR